MKVHGPRPADDTLIMILRSYSRASNIVNFTIQGSAGCAGKKKEGTVTSRGWRGGTARAENGRKRDKAAQRKRDLAHCKAGDDNRLTSALSSSGSSSSLETQLIFVIMPHPPPTALGRFSSRPRFLSRHDREACLLLLRYLRPPIEENEI